MLLASEGARVVVSDIGVDEGRRSADLVVEQIRELEGEAVPFYESVATFEGAERLAETAMSTYGRLDILINNATLRGPGAVGTFTGEQYDRVVDANFKATFATIRAAAPVFMAQRSGAIVNTGSESGLGQPYNSLYAAAKEGVAGLTRSIARELGHFGIRCNHVRPRAAGTQPAEFWETFRKYENEIAALGPYSMGRVGMYAAARESSVPMAPEFVAPLVVWLCTDAAATINGRDFLCHSDEVGLFSEPEVVRSVVREGGWTLDALDDTAPRTLATDLRNEFLGGSAPVT